MSRCKEGQELVEEWIRLAMTADNEKWAEYRSKENPYLKHVQECEQCKDFEVEENKKHGGRHGEG